MCVQRVHVRVCVRTCVSSVRTLYYVDGALICAENYVLT